MELSAYCNSLSGPSLDRYKQKVMEMCDGLDPYSLKKNDLSDDVMLLPAITNMDIVNYLVYSTSTVTGDQMKSYKSLEAYNYFTAGWCHDVAVKVLGQDKVIVMGRVL